MKTVVLLLGLDTQINCLSVEEIINKYYCPENLKFIHQIILFF